MEIWIIFIFAYALLKGSREGMKKAALKKSSSTEILFFYTLIGFIFTAPFGFKAAVTTPPVYIFYTFIKACVVCGAWICAFTALKNMSVSLYGIMDLSRMVFSMLLGVCVLGESLTLPKITGAVLVTAGLIMANMKKDTSKGTHITAAVLLIALMNCFLNAVSGTMDKILMQYMQSSQLQFWYMLFMTLIYGIVILIKKEKIRITCLRYNYWIPVMSLSLAIGDKLLFEACADPKCQVTLMTVIKQSAVVVTVLTGWLVFKEKHIIYKLMCTCVVLGGIFTALLL